MGSDPLVWFREETAHLYHSTHLKSEMIVTDGRFSDRKCRGPFVRRKVVNDSRIGKFRDPGLEGIHQSNVTHRLGMVGIDFQICK